MALNVDILKKVIQTSSREELIEHVLRQALRIEELQSENDDLRRQVSELEAEKYRQAAPFRIEEKRKVSQPKPPGQRKGHRGHYRHYPDHVDQRIKVSLPGTCPQCSGKAIGRIRRRIQFIEEVPLMRPFVTELTTYEGECLDCGCCVESTHPLQVSRAEGSAACHLGPRAQATALHLQYQYGLSKRKTCGILADYFGLKLSPGGLVHLSHRSAEAFKDQYSSLLDKARQSDHLHADETSWYVGQPGHMLWVLTNDQATVYKVVQSRSREQLRALIGQDYQGVLITDCLNIYDEVCQKQQKCYAHHLKFISQCLKKCPQQHNQYLEQVKELLQDILQLKSQADDLRPARFQAQQKRLEKRAEKLLEDVPKEHPQEERVRKRLFNQRDHLFTFLDHPAVPGTNNRAERQLRPAVIARKISCGNRTRKGADSWEVNASLVISNDKMPHDDFVSLLHESLRQRVDLPGR